MTGGRKKSVLPKWFRFYLDMHATRFMQSTCSATPYQPFPFHGEDMANTPLIDNHC